MNRLRTLFVGLRFFGTVVAASLAASAVADDPPKAKGEAPAGHEVLRSAPGGAYFVPSPLNQEFDRLRRALHDLKVDRQLDRVTEAERERRSNDLTEKLAAVEKEIEAKKVLVSAARTQVVAETRLLRLGPEKLLVITADNLRVEGWEGPAIKCVLEKTVLAADDKPVDVHLDGMRLVHKHGPAPELVGRSAAQREADEQTFLASPVGQKLTDEERAARHKFVTQIAEGYSRYRDFQEREIDTVEIAGLGYDEGNRQIAVELSSPGAGGSFSSTWQRHAALTVYVPECRSIALRGCLAGLDVSGVHSALIVSSSGGRDRDYDATFRIRNHFGSLRGDNMPLDLIESVHGDVALVSTVELVNSFTRSDGNQRVLSSPAARELVCRNIDGDFDAWFMRGDLVLSNIAGRIDVRNEFGDTYLAVIRPLARKPHRLLSDAGRIEVRLTREMAGDLPMHVATNCGTVRTNAPRDFLDATYGSITGDSSDGSRRQWRGVWSKNAFSRDSNLFDVMGRLNAVLTGGERTIGFDAISRAGTVVVTVDK